MRSDFSASLAQLTAEKGLQKDELIDMVEAAMVSAYKKDFAGNEEKNIVVRMEPQSGVPHVYEVVDVVETVEDPNLQVTLSEAKRSNPQAVVGGTVEREVTPPNFGRIGAQTAKQVILQRIREAERDHIYNEFIDREGDIITGVVRRIDPRGIVLETGSGGKAEALLPPPEQVQSERHRMGQRIRVYLLEVNRSAKGPMLIVSRAHRNFVRRLMELEIPEIYNGVVEIKAIAREAGSRSKVAVSRQSGLDPVGPASASGACVSRTSSTSWGRAHRHHPLARGAGKVRRQRPEPGARPERPDRRCHQDGRGDRAAMPSSPWPSARRDRTRAWRPS